MDWDSVRTEEEAALYLVSQLRVPGPGEELPEVGPWTPKLCYYGSGQMHWLLSQGPDGPFAWRVGSETTGYSSTVTGLLAGMAESYVT